MIYHPEKLDNVASDLVKLIQAVGEITDIEMVWGYRGEEAQTLAVSTGHSTKSWPTSKHNLSPSKAVDVAPYPINWDDIAGFQSLGATIKAKSLELGIAIRWGGDYVHRKDWDHFELVF